jgi:hypothetical protein
MPDPYLWAAVKKDLWPPVKNWVDPEVGLRVKKIWDWKVFYK